MLPCQQLAPGSSHGDEQIPCEIRDDSTAPFTHACSNTHTRTYVRHRGANSDATTWSYRAPMMINKQRFGWGENEHRMERERAGGSAGHGSVRGFLNENMRSHFF